MTVHRVPLLIGGVLPVDVLPGVIPTDAEISPHITTTGRLTRAAVVAARDAAGSITAGALTTAVGSLVPTSSLPGYATKVEAAAKQDAGLDLLVRFNGTAWTNPTPPAGGWRVFDSVGYPTAPAPPALSGVDRDEWRADPDSTTFDATMTTTLAPVATPVLLSATEFTARAVRLTAQDQAGVATWEWWEEGSAANGPVATTTVPTRDSGATLIQGRTLTYWTVVVMTDGRRSAPSNRISVTIAGGTPTAPLPTPVLTAATEPAAQAVLLTATAITGATAWTWYDGDTELATTTGPAYQSAQTFAPSSVHVFSVAATMEGGLTPRSNTLTLTFAAPPTGVVAFTDPDDDYRIHVTWDGSDTAIGWQVNEVGTPRYGNTTQRLFRSPWLYPGTYSYRVREQTGSTTDPVTAVVTPVYGAWKPTSNTVTVRAEPTPVGNQVKWAPWRDFGANGVRTINVVRDVRITTPGDVELVLPKDKPLAVGRMDWTVALPLGMEDERVRVKVIGGELTPLLAAEIVIKLRANRGRVEWFFQGIKKHGENLGDGIQVDMQELVDTSLTIQDCDIRDVSSGTVQHADVVQVYGGPGNLRWWRNRFSSNYQGFMIHPTQFGKRLDFEAAYFGTYRIEKLHVHMVENVYFPKADPAAAWMGTGYYSIHQGERSPDRFGYPIIKYADCYLTSEDPTHTPAKQPNNHISSRAKLDVDGVTQIGATGNNSPGIWVNVVKGPPPFPTVAGDAAGGSIFPPGITPGLGYVNPGYAARVVAPATPPPTPDPPAVEPDPDTTAPAKPTGFTAVPGNAAITLTWTPGVDDSGDPTRTRIRVNGNSVTIRPEGDTTFVLKVSSSGVPLVNGVEYSVALQAIDGTGNQSGNTTAILVTPTA